MDKILCCIARKSCVVRRSMQEFSRSWSGILLLSLYEQIPPFSSYGRNPQRGLRAAPFFDTPSPLRGEGWDGGGALLLPSPLRRRLGWGWRFTPSFPLEEKVGVALYSFPLDGGRLGWGCPKCRGPQLHVPGQPFAALIGLGRPV